MHVKCRSDGVYCTYYKTHLGHGTTGKNIIHLRLHERDRQFIAEKSRQGVGCNRILDDLQKHGGRAAYAERQDVFNIRKRLGIAESYSYSPSDPISVHHMVTELGNQVLDYKQQTDTNTDFNLVWILKSQEDYLKFQIEGGPNKNNLRFSMDSTYSIGVGKFKLITLLHISNTNQGMPVLFCINNKEDSTVIDKMLMVLKKRVGCIQADVFISDDAQVFRNAWNKIMGPATKYLLCSWHVKCAVRKNIMGNDYFIKQGHKADLYMMFEKLMDEPNVNEFLIMSQNFWKFLDFYGYMKFKSYFMKTYFEKDDQDDRATMWAKCFRFQEGNRTNTNNHIESYHKDVKHTELGGTIIKRVDKTIYVLDELMKRKMRIKLIDIIRTRNNYNKRGFAERCRKSKNLFVEQMDMGKYEVWKKDGKRHKVAFIKSCFCLEACTECGICDHSYSCDCEDYGHNHCCKHLHTVGRILDRDLSKIFDDVVEEEVQMLNKHLIPDKKEEKKVFEQTQTLLTELMSSLNKYSNSIAFMKEMSHHLKRVKAAVNTFEVDNDCKQSFSPVLSNQELYQNLVNPCEPANKSVPRARTFKLNKKTTEASERKKEYNQVRSKDLKHFLQKMPDDCELPGTEMKEKGISQQENTEITKNEVQVNLDKTQNKKKLYSKQKSKSDENSQDLKEEKMEDQSGPYRIYGPFIPESTSNIDDELPDLTQLSVKAHNEIPNEWKSSNVVENLGKEENINEQSGPYRIDDHSRSNLASNIDVVAIINHKSPKPCGRKSIPPTLEKEISQIDLGKMCDSIENGEWLKTDHIDRAQSMLESQNPTIGFQSSLRFQMIGIRNICKTNKRFIQIVNVNHNHWVTLSNVQSRQPTDIFVYDSLFNDFPQVSKEQHLKQIACILKTEKSSFSLHWVDMQKQSNGDDCGLFAIATATAICEGKFPEMYNLQENKMRKHVSTCFKSGTMYSFPCYSECRSNIGVKRIDVIDVICYCRQPASTAVSTIKCVKCYGLFHRYGCNVSNYSMDCNFVCNTCK